MSAVNINVEVQKTGNESSLSLLRRFSKRVQGSGVLNKVRSLRYKTRNQSTLKRKMSTLKFIERRAERERLAKLGKLPVEKKRGRR
ncbi:MAG: hypothetical protein A2849_00045 [Candidatus Taylorbacteria bacterium RIFCSPHIGHO2_01_FULL_51_15]|uniref:30S ribosomal protein S21 n=1 Tax=Candidatus Taylorbacteria bacterium RIFCSPHIGHO2_01_FULL_51_15 TaxID=1802304 RepID=A0A1G2MCD8_9BACT|nr:MAG: hypothetical protein A2849_00045 [Candidatus Taylorbacteria bacterium RIFCSPHIGHO2_01_FULL_51_15]